MAHSLRSKSKLKSKKTKTSNPNSDYFKTNQARTERLAQKLKENTTKQQDSTTTATTTTTNTDTMDTSNDTPEDLTKVKTHGWRKSRASDYKKKKNSKKNKSLKF
ncbi:hypothetical protein C6P40_003022 [Pichia californica]|uniref:DUF2423 domain-containing protein n=1 Tax=Pichia californica TaxID=460514 RepID=A0A9P6WHT7_9ASCO|nr:hypothetical protein C6P42_002558 [[Candida] californica]KAG0687014.1 hypothetical protein C6P40_003022 [[Candida] californica]